MQKGVRARADPPTGTPRKAARLGTREGAGPRTGGKNQPRSRMRTLVPGSLFSPSAYDCAWLLARAQYTGGGEKLFHRCLGGTGRVPPPPAAQSAPAFLAQREPRGRPSFHCCIWGQGRGPEAWTPYLLLQPGAMAPSPSGSLDQRSRCPHPQPRCAPGSRPLKMAADLNLAPG